MAATHVIRPEPSPVRPARATTRCAPPRQLHRPRLVLALVCVSVLAGCAGSGARRPSDTDVATLRTRIADLEARVARAERAASTARAGTAAGERTVGDTATAEAYPVQPNGGLLGPDASPPARDIDTASRFRWGLTALPPLENR